jgi:hydrogenase 3 maturation protease
VDGTAPRVAVLGIGNQLHGDDVAGILIARALKQNAIYGDRLLVINAHIAPENVFGELRRFDPDLVLIIDAAQMGVEPGSVRCIDPQRTAGFSFSTHTLPPKWAAKLLSWEYSLLKFRLERRYHQSSENH